jgi:hypothetical protein
MIREVFSLLFSRLIAQASFVVSAERLSPMQLSRVHLHAHVQWIGGVQLLWWRRMWRRIGPNKIIGWDTIGMNSPFQTMALPHMGPEGNAQLCSIEFGVHIDNVSQTGIIKSTRVIRALKASCLLGDDLIPYQIGHWCLPVNERIRLMRDYSVKCYLTVLLLWLPART